VQPGHEAEHMDGVCGQSNSGVTTTSYMAENLAMRKLNFVIFSNFAGAFMLLQAGCRFGPLSWPSQPGVASNQRVLKNRMKRRRVTCTFTSPAISASPIVIEFGEGSIHISVDPSLFWLNNTFNPPSLKIGLDP
jgi:hypothetical protein